MGVRWDFHSNVQTRNSSLRQLLFSSFYSIDDLALVQFLARSPNRISTTLPPSLRSFFLCAKQNRTGHEQQFISSCVRVVQYGYLAITSSNSLMDTSRRSVALFLPRLSYTPVHQPTCDIKSNCEFCGGVFGPESQLWNSQRVAIIILTNLLLLL